MKFADDYISTKTDKNMLYWSRYDEKKNFVVETLWYKLELSDRWGGCNEDFLLLSSSLRINTASEKKLWNLTNIRYVC